MVEDTIVSAAHGLLVAVVGPAGAVGAGSKGTATAKVRTLVVETPRTVAQMGTRLEASPQLVGPEAVAQLDGVADLQVIRTGSLIERTYQKQTNELSFSNPRNCNIEESKNSRFSQRENPLNVLPTCCKYAKMFLNAQKLISGGHGTDITRKTERFTLVLYFLLIASQIYQVITVDIYLFHL